MLIENILLLPIGLTLAVSHHLKELPLSDSQVFWFSDHIITSDYHS